VTIQTPWRYPGSKRKLAPRLRDLVPADITAYCEPFVGGGSSALPVLEHSTRRLTVLLNDGDSRVADWWSVMIGRERSYQGLLAMIEDQEVTIEAFYDLQSYGTRPANVQLFRAFAAIFLNRTAFSGILSGGPIGGRVQTGAYLVDCRWNPDQLVKQHDRVRDLLSRHDVTVRADDFREVLKGLTDEHWVYADPPYRKQGGRL
jgi:DNA adenine methylase